MTNSSSNNTQNKGSKSTSGGHSGTDIKCSGEDKRSSDNKDQRSGQEISGSRGSSKE